MNEQADRSVVPANQNWIILRKEVIQPHLPIRLPCYDLVPLTPHTLDGSISCELGHRLRVQTIQVT